MQELLREIRKSNPYIDTSNNGKVPAVPAQEAKKNWLKLASALRRMGG